MTALVLCTALLAATAAGCGQGERADSRPLGEVATTAETAGASAPQSPSEAASEPALQEASEPEPEYDNDWQLATPESQGMDSALLESLHEALAEVDINAVVTVKNGVVVDEYYKEGYDETSVFRLASCSKSFTGALVGVAVDQGQIPGVEVKITEYFPQLPADTDKAEITLWHLLTHTSGIEWYEWGGNSSSWRPFREAENWVDHILEQPVVHEPGTQFHYSTGGSHLLGAIVQQATGENLFAYGKEHLFAPLGMDSVEWADDPQGVTDGGNGIAMTARDAAKFGQLYLDGGRWRGRQILPEAWVENSVKAQFERSGNSGSYGYQWWLRPFGGYDTYYAMGHGAQFIFVVPALNLVTVMTSSLENDTYAPWPYFENYIIAANSNPQETTQ